MDIEFLRLDIHGSFSSHTVKHTNTQRSLQTHRPENFKHRSHPFSPPSQTQSLSLITHSFLSQIGFVNAVRSHCSQILSHCQEGSLSSNRSSFSTPFVATVPKVFSLSSECFIVFAS